MGKLSRNRQLFERSERRLRSKAASGMDHVVKPERKFLPGMLQNVLYCTNSMIFAPEGAEP